MAYQSFNYTPIDPATDNAATAFDTVDKNNICMIDGLIASGGTAFVGMLDWDYKAYEPAGTYPPADPQHPIQETWTRKSDTDDIVRLTHAWSGDNKTQTVFEKTVNGGTLWEPMDYGVRTLGKLTYTYSVVVGSTDVVIATTWS